MSAKPIPLPTVGADLAANALALIRGGVADPSVVIWVMSHRCMLSCGHCANWEDATTIAERDRWTMARRLATSRARAVVLCGGEPLMLPDWVRIARLLRRAGKRVMLNTNGWLLEEHAETILELGISAVTVSIDADHAAVHDAIRGREGSFERAVAGLERLRSLRRGGAPVLRVRAVLMKRNLRALDGLVDRFAPLADDVAIQPLHDHPRATAHQVYDDQVRLGPDDEGEVRALIERLRRRHPQIDTAFTRGLHPFRYRKSALRERAVDHCLPIHLIALSLQPDGSAYICTQRLGSLLEQPLARLWASPVRLDLLRRYVRDPGCGHPCWMMSSVLGDPLPGRALRAALRLGGVR
jgi:MoaA/NifB/PqqE/SkfB family radical SAM enzyme